jgi:hypothetical protein
MRDMAELNLEDLVANRTMSAEMAATLAVAAEEARSLLFVAIPRMAGKSTVMRATLRCASHDAPITALSRAHGPDLGIPADQVDGYLVVSEISPAGFDDYLWGADAQRVFASLGTRSLATALHAPTVEQAFDVLTVQNRIPPDQAARIELVTYIRSIGPWFEPTRRVVEQIYEIDGLDHGRPRARLLHRWDEAADQFEVVEPPRTIGTESPNYEAYVRAYSDRD